MYLLSIFSIIIQNEKILSVKLNLFSKIHIYFPSQNLLSKNCYLLAKRQKYSPNPSIYYPKILRKNFISSIH
jgi:hypothetical protein